MSIIQKLQNMNEQEFITKVSECYSMTELHEILHIPRNGRYTKELKNKLNNTNATFKSKKPKYEQITKNCPICNSEFTTLKGSPKEKRTCSYGCSNTLFRSGTNNGSHNKALATGSLSNYRTICFLSHKKECCVCSEHRIVEVHHFDGNKSNNEISNLIPLCPTCHHLYHTNKYKQSILEHITPYRDEFIKRYDSPPSLPKG